MKSIWNSSLFEKIKTIKDSCVIINAHFFYLLDPLDKYIKENKLKTKIAFIFSDKFDFFVDNYRFFPSADELLSTCDCVLTYNVADSEKYGFILSRPAFISLPAYEEKQEEVYDVFYVGKNKGRVKELQRLAEIFVNNGLKIKFVITDVDESDLIPINGIEYNHYISYLEVLDNVGKTKSVLNLVQSGGDGITMRDYEAIGNDKILITNSCFIKKTEFYSRDQVILIDELVSRLDDIKKGYKGHNSFASKYNYESWFMWMKSTVSKNSI